MASFRRRDDGIIEIVGVAQPGAAGRLARFLRRFWGDFPVRASGVKLRLVPPEGAGPATGVSGVRDAGSSGS